MTSELDDSENHVFRELQRHVKAKAKAPIHTCLVRIKADAQSTKCLAKSKEAIYLLVKILRFQDNSIMNATLSLLANICMNSDAREKILDTNVVPNTLWILNNLNVNMNDYLHCRACRLVGNLSDCSQHAKAFYKAGAISTLNDLLHTKANAQTYSMAVRAVRNIWSMYDGSREKIIDCGIFKSITSTFVNAGKRSNESKYVELVENCLKAMLAFTSGINYDSAKQLVGEKNSGFKTLMIFYKKRNKLAIKCVYSLTMIPECRLPLGECDVVEITVDLIQTNVDNLYCKNELVASLCLFCREAVNRNKLRHCSGLPIMLTLLKNKEYEKHHPTLLHALSLFCYDDEGVMIMVKNGLMDILTEKLRNMAVEFKDSDEEKKAPRKRSGDNSPARNDIKYNRSSSGRFSLDYQQDDWSPRSARSGSSTPPSSPTMKLFADFEESEENEEENYSPVCSDDDDEGLHEDIESLKSVSSVVAEEEQGSVKVCKTEINQLMNTWTLTLLSKLSYSDNPIDKLADPTTIGPLAAYIRCAQNPKASRILGRIVKNKAYLIPLIKQGFVFEAQNLNGSEQYTRQLGVLAETGGAIGDIQSILLRGQKSQQSVVAVSLPFLIKSKDLLRCLLNNFGALNLIFDILADSNHTLHKESVWSICQLAALLEVKSETLEKNQPVGFHNTNLLCGMEGIGNPPVVTFELDDGTTLDACRRTLCQRSDVFSAMLEGSFSEAGKRRVKLHNTSVGGFKTLLCAAKGDVSLSEQKIESLLDAVLLADKYLMSEISEMLTESSMSKLNHENFYRAWVWARSNHCHDLRSNCVKSFLTNKMSKAERVSAFHQFSSNDHFTEFLEDIQEAITSNLV